MSGFGYKNTWNSSLFSLLLLLLFDSVDADNKYLPFRELPSDDDADVVNDEEKECENEEWKNGVAGAEADLDGEDKSSAFIAGIDTNGGDSSEE